jgi:hypothetical protein
MTVMIKQLCFQFCHGVSLLLIFSLSLSLSRSLCLSLSVSHQFSSFHFNARHRYGDPPTAREFVRHVLLQAHTLLRSECQRNKTTDWFRFRRAALILQRPEEQSWTGCGQAAASRINVEDQPRYPRPWSCRSSRALLLARSTSPRQPPRTQVAPPTRPLVRGGRTSPQRPRLVACNNLLNDTCLPRASLRNEPLASPCVILPQPEAVARYSRETRANRPRPGLPIWSQHAGYETGESWSTVTGFRGKTKKL